jgi:hypothetical protein
MLLSRGQCDSLGSGPLREDSRVHICHVKGARAAPARTTRPCWGRTTIVHDARSVVPSRVITSSRSAASLWRSMRPRLYPEAPERATAWMEEKPSVLLTDRVGEVVGALKRMRSRELTGYEGRPRCSALSQGRKQPKSPRFLGALIQGVDGRRGRGLQACHPSRVPARGGAGSGKTFSRCWSDGSGDFPGPVVSRQRAGNESSLLQMGLRALTAPLRRPPMGFASPHSTRSIGL